MLPIKEPLLKLLYNILKLLIGLVLLLLLGLYGINRYINSHKDELITEIENWYDEHFPGTLSFENITVSTFDHLPAITINIEQVELLDSLYSTHQYKTLAFEEAELVISLQEVFKEEIQFKSLVLKNGEFNLLHLKDGYSNFNVFRPYKKDSLTKPKNKKKNWFANENTTIQLKNFKTNIYNFQKNKRIRATINNLKGNITVTDSTVSGNGSLEVMMHEMGLNLEKGTFFNDALLQGKPSYVYHIANQSITVPEFDLKINQQTFKIKAAINTQDMGGFNFELTNNNTRYKPTLGLISQNIQAKLKSFDIQKPFSTYTQLEGSFAPGSNPKVSIWFTTAKNQLTIHDTVLIKNVAFKGKFINRAYTDQYAAQEHRKNLKITFNNFSGAYDQIDFTLTNTELVTQETKTSAKLDLKAQGATKQLNSLFKNRDFLFQKGTFSFNTLYAGPVTTLDELMQHTQTNLYLSKSTVYHVPGKTIIPIDSVALHVDENNASLSTLVFPLNKMDHLNLSGKLFNFTTLLNDRFTEKVTAEVQINSKKLRWNDFTALFQVNQAIKTEAETQQNDDALRKTLLGVYEKFNPKLTLAVDNFEYKKLVINTITSELYFQNEHILALKNSGFTFENGKVKLDATFDLAQATNSPFAIHVTTDQLDLGKLLYTFDYFNLPSFKQTSILEGTITLKANMSGIVYDATGLNTKTLTGHVDFNLVQGRIKGFEPLQLIADKVFKKERFEDIRFAPITNTITIKNDQITIPQMEIQSTAFNLFVEGILDYGDDTHFWVSVPLTNIKRRNSDKIPEKIGFAASGKKIYIEVKEDETGKLAYKPHLTNKLMYVEKDSLDFYKSDKKEERLARRSYKKSQRKEKKDSRKNN